jgi:tripartite-type tricarboxylate transporter receptor subunit TctC
VAVQAYASVVGKTIKLIVPFGEAGGSDVWASVVAPYLPRHLPGRPSVVIRNILYGGSINGASGFTTRSRPAGLEFLEAAGSTQLPFAGQKPAVLKRETPAPVMTAYRTAFERMVVDPELVANRGEVLGTTHRRSAQRRTNCTAWRPRSRRRPTRGPAISSRRTTRPASDVGGATATPEGPSTP